MCVCARSKKREEVSKLKRVNPETVASSLEGPIYFFQLFFWTFVSLSLFQSVTLSHTISSSLSLSPSVSISLPLLLLLLSFFIPFTVCESNFLYGLIFVIPSWCIHKFIFILKFVIRTLVTKNHLVFFWKFAIKLDLFFGFFRT